MCTGCRIYFRCAEACRTCGEACA
ncbi:MAG: four-helix bundle copper-binding protein [Muribaculaceae bacterium]